ncbi:type II toxin-antitoxin system VapC family toxin [Leptospirillum ferriphilum]|uniref:type II toxin-antitoxin system VapC family toxin n=1 Tax=Leptospirillum ferriphilum TaxID=178606 RepID=UPI0006B1ABA1|nr:type II toxin-antitoxin system VapC family toxin [Leptospirillum ferriphilum]
MAADPFLSTGVRALLSDPQTEGFISLASVWEMAIKVRLGKLRFSAPLEKFLPEQLSLNNFQILSIDVRHISRLPSLPFHHRDPFDRLLVTQCPEENMPILSRDPVFGLYGTRRIW